jgi:hypothetical protein
MAPPSSTTDGARRVRYEEGEAFAAVVASTAMLQANASLLRRRLPRNGEPSGKDDRVPPRCRKMAIIHEPIATSPGGPNP